MATLRPHLFLLITTLALPAYAKVIYTNYFNLPVNLNSELCFPMTEVHEILSKAAANLGYSMQTGPQLPERKNLHAILLFGVPDGNLLQKLQHNYPSRKLVLFLWEPPVVAAESFNKHVHNLFHKVFTWNDDLIDNKKYFKFLYAQSSAYIQEPLPFHVKKFCCLMAGNKQSPHPKELYTARARTIGHFKSKNPSLDLYGPGWQGYFSSIYKGITNEKIETLRNYKFCICYENMHHVKGYITEKIKHCLFASCVPVYWGASNITDYIPEDCFIDRRKFKNDEELYQYLVTMPEATHQRYIENIQQYLASDIALLFSPVYFAECVLKGIIPHYDRNKAFNEQQIKILEAIDQVIKNRG